MSDDVFVERAAPGAQAVALLERLLANEGRNALSRVELAASELARGAWPPACVERILSIREAVAELDGVFEKLERLVGPARAQENAVASDVVAVWHKVAARVGPVLAASGVDMGSWEGPSAPPVRVAPCALERVYLLALRTLATACGGERRGADAPARVAPSFVEREGRVEVVLRLFGGESRIAPERLAREARLELDLALAEWDATSTVGPAGSAVALGLLLLRGRADA